MYKLECTPCGEKVVEILPDKRASKRISEKARKIPLGGGENE